MQNTTKGFLAGIVASIVLSVVMVLLTTAGFEQFDIVTLIDRLGSIGRGGAWADHFIVGIMLWGPLYGGFDYAMPPETPPWIKGLIFGVGAWLAMMLIFMPVVGVGLFGARLGLGTPVAMLVLHLLFGVVLAMAFDYLGSSASADKKPASSRTA